MFKSIYPKRIVVICAVICLCIGSADAKDVLELAPADCLFCVRVNNFDYALWTADQFLAGVSPVPMGLAMMGRMQLATVLGDPNLSGVNMQGSFAIFGLGAAGANEPDIFIAGLIPVTDYGQFVSGNLNCSDADGNGISKITSPAAVLVMQTGGYALVSTADNYSKMVSLRSVSSPLAGVLDEAEKTAAKDSPFWAYGNVEQVLKNFGPVIFGQLEQMKAAAASAKQPGYPQAAKFLDIYFEAFKSLLDQTKAVSIALKPSAMVCNLSCNVSAKPGTEMAKVLASGSVAKGPNKLLGYLDNGAMMNMASKVNKPMGIQIYEKFTDLFAPLMGEKFTEADKTKLNDLISRTVNSLGNSITCSQKAEPDSKPPFTVKYVIEVQDIDTLNKCIDESTAMFNAGLWDDLFKTMGLKAAFTIKRNAAVYKEISIDIGLFTMEAIDPNSQEMQMMAAMYGDGMQYRMAFTNGLLLCTAGANADSEMKALIDLVKSGGPKESASEIKAAQEFLVSSDDACCFMTYNYLRMLKMASAMMPMPGVADMFSQINVESKSNIAIAGKVTNGKIGFELALPKEHLMEMFSAFMTMQQQMMPAQPQTPNEPAAQPTN